MKELKYTILPGTGRVEKHRRGTIKDLLCAVPYFFFEKDVIPPLPILNDFLRHGLVEAGMSGGCRWRPCALTEAEYAELIEDLLTDPARDLSLVEVPPGVENYYQWYKFRLRWLKKHR